MVVYTQQANTVVDGHVVGGGTHFTIRDGKTLTDLGASLPLAINDAGQVVGNGFTPYPNATE